MKCYFSAFRLQPYSRIVQNSNRGEILSAAVNRSIEWCDARLYNVNE